MADAEQLDALLPQTQCTRCGYAGCLPYAQAMATGGAELNQCPPGGTATIERLARALGRPPLPLNPAHGTEGTPLLAQINEAECIGCAKCLPPCPVDAIVGARKQMHTVITALCTGCELCVAPCPVDCIEMVPRSAVPQTPEAPTPDENRTRYAAHRAREQRRREEHAAMIAARKAGAGASGAPSRP
jgi:Na+-translocating ferredoxin:NAD+ oxidoreductase subunit B